VSHVRDATSGHIKQLKSNKNGGKRRDRTCAPKHSGGQAQKEGLFVIQSRKTRDWITRFIVSEANSAYFPGHTKSSFSFGGLSPFDPALHGTQGNGSTGSPSPVILSLSKDLGESREARDRNMRSSR